jgi:hypothetical protein
MGPIHEKTSGWKITKNFPSGRFIFRAILHPGDSPSGRFSIRAILHPGDSPSGGRTPRPGVPTVIIFVDLSQIFHGFITNISWIEF